MGCYRSSSKRLSQRLRTPSFISTIKTNIPQLRDAGNVYHSALRYVVGSELLLPSPNWTTGSTESSMVYPLDHQGSSEFNRSSPLETVATMCSTVYPFYPSVRSSLNTIHKNIAPYPNRTHRTKTVGYPFALLLLRNIFPSSGLLYSSFTPSFMHYSTTSGRYQSKPNSSTQTPLSSVSSPPTNTLPKVTITTSPQYHALQSRFQRIRTLLAENRIITSNDISSILEDSIASGQLPFAVEMVETLAVTEQQNSNYSSLVTPDHIQHVIAAAALQRDIASSDRIMRIAFSSPHTRLDERVATIYTYLVAGMEQPDHQRGFALCTVLEETTLIPYAAYLNAVQKNHGIQGLMSTLTFANKLQPSLSLRAWLTILQSIKQARSEDLKAVFHTIMRIAKEHFRKFGENNDGNYSNVSHTLASTKDDRTVPVKQSIETVQNEKLVYGVIYDIYIDALLAHGLLIDATKECRNALKAHCRLLSGPSHIANGCLTRIKGLPPGARDRRTFLDISLDMTTYTLESMTNYSSLDYIESSANEIQKLTGINPTVTTTIDLSELLKRCMEEEWWTKVMNITRLILQQTEQNMRNSYGSQSLISNEYKSSTTPMTTTVPRISNPLKQSNSILIGRKMIESILGGLVRAGKIPETEELFLRMQEFSKLRHLPGSDLLRPRDHAYNIMVKFYARYRNPVKAKQILNDMQRLGFQPEPSALAALANLRNEINNENNTGSVTNSSELTNSAMLHASVSTKVTEKTSATNGLNVFHASSVSESSTLLSVQQLDSLVLQLTDNRASSPVRTTGRRSTSDIATYNNILIGYFRNQTPLKALQYLYQLQGLGFTFRLDTLRIVFQGLLLSGNQSIHGIGTQDIEKLWKNKVPMDFGAVNSTSTLPGLRSRMITLVPKYRRTESTEEEFPILDLSPIANLLAEYRIALYSSLRSAGYDEGTDDPTFDPVENSTLYRYCTKMIQTNPSMYPLFSSTVSIRSLLYLLTTVRLRTTTGTSMHPWMEYKVVQFSPNAQESIAAVQEIPSNAYTTSPTTDELYPHDALIRNPASLEDYFNGNHGLTKHNADNQRDIHDYLHYLPSLIQPLITTVQSSRSSPPAHTGNVAVYATQITAKDLSSTCSDIVRNALLTSLPVRSLQSLLLLYLSGAFINTLTISSRLSSLLPKLRIIDIRGIDADVATIFVQIILSSVLEHALRSIHRHNVQPPKPEGIMDSNLHYVPLNSIAFLTGPSTSRTTLRVRHALSKILPPGSTADEINVPSSAFTSSVPTDNSSTTVKLPNRTSGSRNATSSSPRISSNDDEIIPSLPSVSTELRAIVINSTVLEEWILMERNRIRQIVKEPLLDIEKILCSVKEPRNDDDDDDVPDESLTNTEVTSGKDNLKYSESSSSDPLVRVFDVLRSRLSPSK